MSSDAIKMVEAFVKDPLSYDRFGPELISNQKCVLNINGHEMSIDEAVKMSDIEKGLLGEIYELIDAMTKTEANFSPGKKNPFSSGVRLFNRFGNFAESPDRYL